ncbi:acid phosphatase [Francisella salimarina]|uniref:acid phosphatase n=1 Tax=Francisella salimarina TaxID=2599927 RepID=UPI0037503AE6
MIRKILFVGSLTAIISSAFAADRLNIDIPDIKQIIPPPPTPGTLLYQNDMNISHASFFIKNTNRYKLAQSDANYSPEGFAQAFEKAFGHQISKKETPAIWKILNQLEIAEGEFTKPAKLFYHRTRPFAYFHEKACVKTDNIHRSYPSGHTTIGWAIALTLSEINPSRTNQIMKRGYEFGQNRIVCGVHYPSDVNAGYLVGSIMFSQLQTSPEFQQEIKLAKKEISKN